MSFFWVIIEYFFLHSLLVFFFAGGQIVCPFSSGIIIFGGHFLLAIHVHTSLL